MSLKSISDKIENKIEEKRNKAKSISIKEGMCNSFSEGCGINYIIPYALAMNANNTQI